MTTWNITDTFSIEELCDDDLPEVLAGKGITELEITYRSNGYWERASMYGGPDNLGWPEEGEDERTIENVTAHRENGEEFLTTKVEKNLLFDHFQKKVDEQELPFPEYDQ